MATQNLLAITGNRLSHKYFVNQLVSHFKLSAVFIEKVHYPDPFFNSDKERKAWKEFFLNRQKIEESLLRFSENNHAQNNPKIFKLCSIYELAVHYGYQL